MANIRDLEMIRRLLKGVNDYMISLSSEDKARELFEVATENTKFDWVVCHQYANFLLQREDFDGAISWIARAIQDNPTHATLYHTKGNILRRWAMKLELEKSLLDAEKKYDEASQLFAISRVRPEPDEYGYVTHLDMILHRLNSDTRTESEKTNLIAEGVSLYSSGLKAISEDRYNYLMEPRFRQTFDLNEGKQRKLCERIRQAVFTEKASVQAAVFLANCLYRDGQYEEAIKIIGAQKKKSGQGALIWIKEAELFARRGLYSDAAKAIDSAKRRESSAENADVIGKLHYWGLLIAFVRAEYKEAGNMVAKLQQDGYRSRRGIPQGYIWKETARSIDSHLRNFENHAKIYTGRVTEYRFGGQYGGVQLTNASGETFYIAFNPRYFSRKNFSRGDHLRFVVSILPNGIRADDTTSKPFVDTTDDLFMQ